MRTKGTKIRSVLILTVLGCFGSSWAQHYYNMDYQCLEEPLEFFDVHELNYRIICNHGETSYDTIETPCNEGFYSQDHTNVRAHYFISMEDNSDPRYSFGDIIFRNDEEFDESRTKYFELNKATLWYYFTGGNDKVEKISLELIDISGQGVNFGTKLEGGPEFYHSLDDLNYQIFDGVHVEYNNGLLEIEGQLERLFIGGDHLYISNLEYNEISTENDELHEDIMNSYPQPFHDVVKVEMKRQVKGHFILTDMYGRTILTDKMDGKVWTRDLSFLPSGFFALHFREGKKTVYTQRLIKN